MTSFHPGADCPARDTPLLLTPGRQCQGPANKSAVTDRCVLSWEVARLPPVQELGGIPELTVCDLALHANPRRQILTLPRGWLGCAVRGLTGPHMIGYHRQSQHPSAFFHLEAQSPGITPPLGI